MKPYKLPSGKWRFQPRRVLPDGTHERISVTFDSYADRRKWESYCRKWQAEATLAPVERMTVAEAIAVHIGKKEASGKSPSTIRAYRAMERTAYAPVGRLRVDRITADDMQELVDTWIADAASPKTIKNRYMLILAAVRDLREFSPRVDLPAIHDPGIYAPTGEEVAALIRAATGTELEVPILLAAFGPMRRGEICALDASDVDGQIVHVRRALARADGGKWVTKSPKTAAGERSILYPPDVAARLPREGRVCPMSPDELTREVSALVDSLGLPHFTIHGLRHFAASYCHGLGIPDAVIARRAGWSKIHTMKAHYLHVLPPQEAKANEQINDAFGKVLHLAM